MTKKTHPADAADTARIASATSFNVHIRRGPADKINRPAVTLIEAIGIADEMTAENGKGAMIYAVTAEGASVFVPPVIVLETRLAIANLPIGAARGPFPGTPIAGTPERPAASPLAGPS